MNYCPTISAQETNKQTNKVIRSKKKKTKQN